MLSLMHSLALMFHVLAAVIWVGGMFFAYVLLRPVLVTIDAPQRLTIWAKIFKKFFPWVWFCIIVLLATGFYMIYLMGGFSDIGNHIYAMLGLAVIMIVIFKFVCVAPFRHLCRGVEQEKWEVAAYALGTIRKLVAVNLGLGILTIVAATALADRI
ncbi:CopD family protein [Candidatus Spongiihabitans sp.]|uniref:CopD family protein n=1 Tax=Candidatus Spongiihabitans sp. TaxID=3101308 RepID=UPI003C6F6015